MPKLGSGLGLSERVGEEWVSVHLQHGKFVIADAFNISEEICRVTELAEIQRLLLSTAF